MTGPFEDAEARSLIEPDYHDDSCPPWCGCRRTGDEDDGPEPFDVANDR